MQSLFEAVRAACSPTTWSRGVELTRRKAVSQERAGRDERVFRVVTRGGMICPRVTLYTDDDDWDCDCPSREPACEHVAAAVIACRQAEERGDEITAAEEAAGHIRYRFFRQGTELHLERLVRYGGGWHTLESTIAALTSRRVDGPPVAATQADLAVELVLDSLRPARVPRHSAEKLLAALTRCEDVRLEEDPVGVSRQPVLPVVRVTDQGDGFRLQLVDEENVAEVFDNGMALAGNELRPIGASKLSGSELHRLPRGSYYGPDRIAELVTEVLPSLAERVRIDARTDRLPRAVREKPRILIDVQREGETLTVLPTLVYGDPPTARIDGGRLVHLQGAMPLRDDAEERRQVGRLQRELGLAPGVRVPFHGEEGVRFARRLERWQGEVKGAAHRWFREAPPLVPRLRLDPASFEVGFEVEPSSGGARAGRADAGAVLRAWREGASLVPLVDGGWSPLPADWLTRHGERLADLLAAREEAGQLPGCALPDLARMCEELDRPAPPRSARLRSLAESFAGIPEAALPGDVRACLRDYQRRGVDWLVFLREAGLGGMLADDMGLGKTLQALCAVRGRTLVVAPTSVMQNWLEEAARFRPGLRCSRYHGPDRTLDPSADLTVTTYAILRLDEDALAGERWDTVVLDEAQAIKNPESQVAQAAYRLQAGFRLTLTGTPVENRLDELWSQFHFANRGLLGGRRDFDERYARPISNGKPGVAQRLRERIRPFLLRRLKDEVASELPPRTDVVLHCELSAEERAVYDTVRAATLSSVVERLQKGGSILAALEALLRLRQAACHPALVPGQSASTSAKVELLRDALETVVAEGRKALVFSQWTSMLDLVEPHLRGAGISFLRLDGSTRDRAAVVRDFQNVQGPPTMLISLRAGGTGLNLTAADHVFILDPWWNPAVEDQAADRAHRIGQERPVMVYRLVAEETVEERILALQQRKRELADAALGDADQAASITRDELLALLA